MLTPQLWSRQPGETPQQNGGATRERGYLPLLESGESQQQGNRVVLILDLMAARRRRAHPLKNLKFSPTRHPILPRRPCFKVSFRRPTRLPKSEKAAEMLLSMTRQGSAQPLAVPRTARHRPVRPCPNAHDQPPMSATDVAKSALSYLDSGTKSRAARLPMTRQRRHPHSRHGPGIIHTTASASSRVSLIVASRVTRTGPVEQSRNLKSGRS